MLYYISEGAGIAEFLIPVTHVATLLKYNTFL